MGIKMKNKKFGEKVKSAKNKLPVKKKSPVEHGPIEIRMLSAEEAIEADSISEHKLIEELNGTESESNYKFESNKKYFTICVYALVTIIAATIIICFVVNFGGVKLWMKDLAKILSPFIAAFLIAFLLNPLVKWMDSYFFHKLLHLEKPKLRGGLSILLTYLLVFGIIIVGMLYVIPQITDSIISVAGDVTIQLNKLYEERHVYASMIEEHFPDLDLEYFEDKLEELWPTLLSGITNITKNLVPKLVSMTVSIAKMAINVFLSIAISIYMLTDKRKLLKMGTKGVYAILPTARAKYFCSTMKECGRIFSSFVSGKALDSLIIGILCFITMSILKLDYALLLSVIVGITNMIPYFGPFIGAVPGVVFYLCIRPIDAVIFIAMILVLQQFDGWILGPKILGDSTGLSPLWVIFGITIGGAYAGVLGMFLGVPLVAVIAYLLNQAIDSVLKKKRVEVL